MKFKKKPIIIDAEQFQRNSLRGWPLGVYRDGEGRYFIDTLEGTMRVGDGDWIVTGIQGERYAVRSDIFEATYEAVNE